jgi:hypothetical protein
MERQEYEHLDLFKKILFLVQVTCMQDQRNRKARQFTILFSFRCSGDWFLCDMHGPQFEY